MEAAFDFHMHTWYSADAASSPEEMIAAARERGLKGVALTDHDTSEAVAYVQSKGLMREDGQAVDGFLVVPGQEVSTADGHVLCLGVPLPSMKGRRAREVCEEIHARGGLAVPAHPFDFFRAGVGEENLRSLPIDAVEVFNAASTFARFNRRAAAVAEELDLPGLANSDAHHDSMVGTASTILNVGELTLETVLQAILAKNRLECHYLTAREYLKKSRANLFRRKPPMAPVAKKA